MSDHRPTGARHGQTPTPPHGVPQAAPAAGRHTLLAIALVVAFAIFLVDTLSPLEGAVAVLYVTVVLLAARTSRRRDILAAAGGAIALTLLSYVSMHGLHHVGSPTIRAIVSLAAIGVTAMLALQNQMATAALSRSESRYRRMFDASRIGVVEEDWSAIRATLDAAGFPGGIDLARRIARDPDTARRVRGLARVVDVNPAMLAMLGRSSAVPLMGGTGNLLIVNDRVFAETLEAFARGESFYEGESEILRSDGMTVPILFTITFPTRPDGDGTVLIFVVDITERRQAQDALLKAQAELAHAARAATLGELSASIAHEVNQPLMAVVTSGEAGLRWLRRASPELDEVDQSISRIVAEGRRASQIVARIRSFVKKAPVQKDVLSIATIIEEAVLLVERELSAAQVELSIDIQPGLPEIRGDRIQLQQILVNLMVNAGQAMATREGPRRLHIAATHDGSGGVAVGVADTGPGIASEDLPRLFEPFFTTRQQGMGMGLAICRTTAEAHGGHLSVESRPGEGATFRLSLPAATEEVAAP